MQFDLRDLDCTLRTKYGDERLYVELCRTDPTEAEARGERVLTGIADIEVSDSNTCLAFVRVLEGYVGHRERFPTDDYEAIWESLCASESGRIRGLIEIGPFEKWVSIRRDLYARVSFDY